MLDLWQSRSVIGDSDPNPLSVQVDHGVRVHTAGRDGVGDQLADDQHRRVDAVECRRGTADGLTERPSTEPSRGRHGDRVAWKRLLALLAHPDSSLTLFFEYRPSRACVPGRTPFRPSHTGRSPWRRHTRRSGKGEGYRVAVRVETRPGVDGRALLHVSGELDVQFADELRDAGLAAAADSGLAMNLSEVSFIDSSGLAALIEINNTIGLRGQAFTLVAPSRSVRRILEVTGLNPVFDVID
jgi:anti-anti-sigma factor